MVHGDNVTRLGADVARRAASAPRAPLRFAEEAASTPRDGAISEMPREDALPSGKLNARKWEMP